MFTLGIPLKQKRRTLGYLSNEYFPGGMKKLGQQVPYEIISTDREGGFFVISFPDMGEDEFRSITFQLKQQGVTVIGADSQLTEKTMKLVNLVPLKENKGTQVTDYMWRRMSDDEKIDALYSVVKDPDEAQRYFELDWEELPSGFERDMRIYEGSCGYAPDGEDPNEADQPAGPHLMRKKIREMIEAYADDPNVPGTTGMEDAGGKVRDNILTAIPDNYSIKDLAQDIAYIIQNEYGSHNAKPFIQMVSQKLQKPNY